MLYCCYSIFIFDSEELKREGKIILEHGALPEKGFEEREYIEWVAREQKEGHDPSGQGEGTRK